MTDPEKQDPKKQDETVEQPTAAAQESGGTELSDEELSDAAGGGGSIPDESLESPVPTWARPLIGDPKLDPGVLD